MALARWLAVNNGSEQAYYYAQAEYDSRDSHYYPSGLYHWFSWDAHNVALGDAWKQSADKSRVISEIDSATGQNAFHCVFSTPLCQQSVESKDYYISSAEGKRLITNGQWKLYAQGSLGRGKIAEHSSLLKENKITSVNDEEKNFRRDIKTDLINSFLGHFTGDQLIEAFLQKDKPRGNTPLFYVFQDPWQMDVRLLYNRISAMKKSNPSDVKKLFLEGNQEGKTLVHVFFSNPAWENWKWITDMLDPDSIKEALCQKDGKGNTPLHDLCLLRKEIKMDFFEKAVAAMSATNNKDEAALEQKGKSGVSRDFFPDNHDLANPLHYFCQRTPSHANLTVLSRALKIPGLSGQKIMRHDRFGMTPVHYAIRSGNFDLAICLLNFLHSQDRYDLLTMKYKNQQETLLHYICQHGNQTILDKAITILGPLELYNIQKALPLKARPENANLTQKNLDDTIKTNSRLFDVFDYFAGTYQGDSFEHAKKQSADFNDRFVDFCDWLAAFQMNKPLPLASDKFLAKTHGFSFSVFGHDVKLTRGGSETYHSLRAFLGNNVTRAELEDFVTFLGSTALKSHSKKLLVVAQLILNRVKKYQKDLGEEECKDVPKHRVNVLAPTAAPVIPGDTLPPAYESLVDNNAPEQKPEKPEELPIAAVVFKLPPPTPGLTRRRTY